MKCMKVIIYILHHTQSNELVKFFCNFNLVHVDWKM